MLRTSNYLVTAICGVNMVMTKNFLCSRMRLTPIHRESKKNVSVEKCEKRATESTSWSLC